MSDQLPPRRRIEPLAPPPGEFDRVMNQARYRRHKRALAMLSVAFVFVAGLGGGLAMGRNVPQRVIDAATNAVSGEQSESPSASPTAKTAASKSPKDKKPANQNQRPATKLASPPKGALAYRGQAIGSAGQPAAGLYVYVGVPSANGFQPSGWSIGRTDSNGKFSLACPHAPILLAPWPILGDAKSKARNVAWSATFVGGATNPEIAEDAPCNRGRSVDTTIMGRGSAVEGTASMPDTCQTEVRSMRVWLHNDPLTYVKVQDLADGETFRVSGLPPGQHTLDAKGNLYQFLVGGGQTEHKDVTFPCEGDEPTVPPTDLPTTPPPTVTASPDPSESPTDTHSATTSPSPSQTPTP